MDEDRTIQIILTLLLVSVIAFLLGMAYGRNQTFNRVSKELRDRSYEDLENIKRKYGSYDQDNEELNKVIEIEFQMEGWKFDYQRPFKLVETNDTDLPFLATEEIVFVNPNNENIIRELTKMYIYDFSNSQWIPLKLTLKEMNLKTKDYNVLEDYRIWQGDWEIPFIETAKSTSTLEELAK